MQSFVTTFRTFIIKQMLIIIGSLLILLIGLEYGLKSIFGLGRPMLYVADPTMGYRVAPNQITRRFGNRIRINEFSMRNDPITPERSPQTLRLLMLGDSLVNGVLWTDQSEILTAHVQRDTVISLLPRFPEMNQIEVLNVSAGSWGPRNQLAYLHQFGCFQSQAVILVLNTDDFFGQLPTPEAVGHDPNYPDRYPPSALVELLQQVWRRIPGKAKLGFPPPARPTPPPERNIVEINLKTIALIAEFSRQEKAQFFLVLSPLKRELTRQGGSRDYEQTARNKLQAWTAEADVPYLDLLPLFNLQSDPMALYDDHIHLSQQGNQIVSKAIVTLLNQHLY